MDKNRVYKSLVRLQHDRHMGYHYKEVSLTGEVYSRADIEDFVLLGKKGALFLIRFVNICYLSKYSHG